MPVSYIKSATLYFLKGYTNLNKVYITH